ncbi:MAG: hypothetical protein KKE20_00160 [Nanoarchaeota archaeon]|nr:hypothetical protein [Nanoarchaeota archaeon]
MSKKKAVKKPVIRESGWAPMPLSIKILFVLVCIEFIGILLRFRFAPSIIIRDIFLLVLIVALWNRYIWAWIYGAFYYVISVLMSFGVFKQFVNPLILGSANFNQRPLLAAIAISAVLTVIINGAFIIILIIKREYFSKQ